MAETPEDICNLALVEVGQSGLIDSMETDGTPASDLCLAVYAHLRDKTLRAVWWPFATQHVNLAQLGYTRTGWAYAYAEPQGCISPQYISNGERRGAPLNTLSAVISPDILAVSNIALAVNAMRIPFAVELNNAGTGRIILCDVSPAELIYTAQVTNVTVFPEDFAEALSFAIAEKLASGLLKKPDLAQAMHKKYLEEIAKAWSSAMRAQQEDVPAMSEFIATRG